MFTRNSDWRLKEWPNRFFKGQISSNVIGKLNHELIMYRCMWVWERERESYLINRMNVTAISCVHQDILKTQNCLLNFDQIIKTKSQVNWIFLSFFSFKTFKLSYTSKGYLIFNSNASRQKKLKKTIKHLYLLLLMVQ